MAADQPTAASFGQRRFRHVFVLCTGRCGSVTFARACGHFTNYTVGHETNRASGPGRLEYPVGHIEVDNRLAWFLGGLEERYGEDAFYVHLLREEEQVAASYDRRWHHRTSLIRGFDQSLCMHRQPEPAAARDLVVTVNTNIRVYLRHKPHVITGDIDAVQSWFLRFATAIGAAGDIDAALAEFRHRHNASVGWRGGGSDSEETRRWWQSEAVIRPEQKGETLAVEATRLKVKASRAKRVAWLLAAPWLIAAAPLTIPALWLAARRRRGRSWKASGGLRWPRFLTPRSWSRRTLVYDAFLAHKAEGPRQAAAILARAGTACPPGARELFRAMTARSDAEWLAATNAWAAAAAVPTISLRPGPGPRFERLELAPAEPVLAHDKVSVIMPAYNARATLEQAARSILSQSWRNLELIIVDDCSTDGTADLAEQLAAEDARVRVLRNPANVGPYVSKNRALLLATGRYVTGHDADDIAIPTRIADQMKPIRDDAACVATIASMVRLDRDGAFSHPTKIGNYSYDGIARRAMISLLIEREVLLERLGFWDTVRFGADSELLTRATAVLGPRLREVRKVVMLCLNAEGSLTNNTDHGITIAAGISPIRQAYRQAWEAWHAGTPVEQQRLPFPHLERRFAAPEAMLVPAAALEAVAKADEGAGRRRAA